MSNAPLWLTFAGETMFPPCAPFSVRAWQPPGSPHASTLMGQRMAHE